MSLFSSSISLLMTVFSSSLSFIICSSQVYYPHLIGGVSLCAYLTETISWSVRTLVGPNDHWKR